METSSGTCPASLGTIKVTKYWPQLRRLARASKPNPQESKFSNNCEQIVASQKSGTRIRCALQPPVRHSLESMTGRGEEMRNKSWQAKNRALRFDVHSPHMISEGYNTIKQGKKESHVRRRGRSATQTMASQKVSHPDSTWTPPPPPIRNSCGALSDREEGMRNKSRETKIRRSDSTCTPPPI